MLRAPPRLLAITPPSGAVDGRCAATWIAAGAPAAALALLLRTPGDPLPDPADPRWRDLRDSCAERGIRVLLSCDTAALIARIDACGAPPGGVDGFQLKGDPAPALLGAARARLGPGPMLSRSCHFAAPAGGEQVDFSCLGPIFAPRTVDPGALKAARGLELLREWNGHGAAVRGATATSRGPVLALGGVSADNAASCLAAGAFGLASIHAFFGDPPRVRDEVARMVVALAPLLGAS